jgi:segregation and condensation protein A
MDYTVRLASFEGPLDLLLFLIRKNELDIYDIPMSIVVTQYIEYLDGIDQVPLDRAGEYLLMLATLLRIKSRMLLPGEPADEEEPLEDPRTELVQKLLEYQRFKELAGDLREKAEVRSLLFGRGGSHDTSESFQEESPELELEIDTLLTAFREAMQRLEFRDTYVFEPVAFTVEEKMEVIVAKLTERRSIDLEHLFTECRSKMELIVVFLALLELMRWRRLRVRQRDAFGRLVITATTETMPAGETPAGEEGVQ